MIIYLQKNKNIIEEFIIPAEIKKNELLKNIHESTGHTGYIRLAYEIKNNKKHYWKYLYLDCKKCIENCPQCLTFFVIFIFLIYINNIFS